jgi:hypothetical protein
VSIVQSYGRAASSVCLCSGPRPGEGFKKTHGERYSNWFNDQHHKILIDLSRLKNRVDIIHILSVLPSKRRAGDATG